MLTNKDLKLISAHGLHPSQVERQMEAFRSGFGFLPIDRAATVGDGITRLSEKQITDYITLYDNSSNVRTVKFVPASGAATRMFKELFEFVADGQEKDSVRKIVDNTDKFAFYPLIREKVSAGPIEAVKAIIDYGAESPKALILFHSYQDGPRTAMEEHLAEGAMYAADKNSRVSIHFTVSPEHRERFRDLLENVQPRYEEKHGKTYDISFSEQLASTDTIAVTPDNEPFRDDNGQLVFRPAGHGALLENVDRLDADIIFVKNIDNVTTDKLRDDTIKYKKAMAGMLLSVRNRIFDFMHELDNSPSDRKLEEIEEFIRRELFYQFPGTGDHKNDRNDRAARIRKVLDRPLRICAMVRNTGEPGGGPFHVKATDGSVSLQIAEPSQISPEQANLLKEGTHFNPADLVCSVKDHKGEKYDLKKFVDHSTGFISEKSKDGRKLKALELPGLWNGSMSDWNTVFVEVPVSTFTPVKEVVDLLRPEHQQ